MAYSEQIKDKGGQVYNVKKYGAKGDGTTNDASAIQTAINAATTAGGGTIYLPKTTASYKVSTEIVLKSNVTIRGDGIGATKIMGAISGGWTFKNFEPTTITDFSIQDLTIDLSNMAAASAIRLEYATRGLVRGVQIKNIGTSGWGLYVGVTTGSDTAYRNFDILVERCQFDTLAGTLEQFLLFNSQRVTVRDCHFYNAVNTTGNCLGLYQVLDSILIEGNNFEPVGGRSIYYSLSTHNIRFKGNEFKGNAGVGNGVVGANPSDNGTFGETLARDLLFEGNKFYDLSSGLQLGAVQGARVIGNMFESNVNGVIVDAGNLATSPTPTSYFIIGNTFRNNNVSANNHILHPGVFFRGVGGSHYARVIGNDFFDDQATTTQRYPISFDGALTWDHITIAYNRLSAGTSGTSIGLGDGAALGSNVKINNNQGYSGTNPAQDAAAKIAIVVGPTGDYLTDGIADNVQILAAMTAAQLVGAEVHLQEGVFDLAAQIVFHNKDNITVRGAGKGKTILRASFSANQSLFDIGSGSGPTVYSNITFTDFTLDQNNIHTGWGLVLTWCRNVLVENVAFINAKSGSTGAQLMVGKFTGSSDSFEARNIVIRGCLFDYQNTTLSWEFSSTIGARDVTYDNCRWVGTGGGGGGRQGMLVYLSEQVRFIGCWFDHTTLGLGGRGTYSLVGCHFEQSYLQVWKASNLYIGGGTTFNEDVSGNITGTVNGMTFQGGYELGGEGETAWFNPNYNFATTDVDVTNNTIAISGTSVFPTGTAIGIGTTGTRPSPFVADTIYYAINVDSTHIKVATSQANALAGTAIDITTQGTGTHTVGVNITWNCENLVIDGVIFKKPRDTAVRAKTTTEHGVQVLDARDITISNCKIDGAYGIAFILFGKSVKVLDNEFRDCNANNSGSTNTHMIVAGEDVTIAGNYSKSPNVVYDIQVDHARYTSLLGNMTLHLDPGGFSATNLVRYYDSGGVLQVQPTPGVIVDFKGNYYKDPVRVATTAALAANTATTGFLTASANGALATIDGVSLALFDRMLVKNEATGSHNGIYYVADLGSSTTPWVLARTLDAKHSAEVRSGLTTRSTEGTANANSAWVLTTANPITLGTTSLTFTTPTAGYAPGGTDVAIADGGTGASTATAAFNALDPLTTKGDIIANNGTDSVRVGVGVDGQVLAADSTQSAGVKWSNAGTTVGYTLQAFMGVIGTAADASTYYFGSRVTATVVTSAGTQRIYIPRAGTVKAVYVFFSTTGTLATSETGTVSLRLNNATDTTISSAVVNNAAQTVFNNTGLSISVAQGDFFEMKWATPTWATNPTNVIPSAVVYIE